MVNDLVIWISGSNGQVGRSTDGGQTWNFSQLEGYEKTDFRSLFAFDEMNALVASAGSPAIVLRTNDGGRSWIQVYYNPKAEMFIDGMDFWNENEGVLYGDPIIGSLFIMETHNSGYTWEEIDEAKRPKLDSGEASFAASNSGIRCLPNGNLIICTGGLSSRLLRSNLDFESWDYISTPIIQHEEGSGIFSVAVNEKGHMVIVGGNYSREDEMKNHIFLSYDNGESWHMPASPSLGYRENVEFLSDSVLIATGPSGTEVSYDKGQNWKSVQKREGMHVVRKARSGSLVVMAGRNGRIFILK